MDPMGFDCNGKSMKLPFEEYNLELVSAVLNRFNLSYEPKVEVKLFGRNPSMLLAYLQGMMISCFMLP